VRLRQILRKTMRMVAPESVLSLGPWASFHYLEWLTDRIIRMECCLESASGSQAWQ
jgi:hypothetical protein